MQSIGRLRQEKLQEDTIRPKSLQYLEYQMSFILIDLQVTVNFTIRTILGIAIVTNHLRRSLERFAKFPIDTTKEDAQPRLLLVAVDVADGIPVTFDSYPKEDGSRKTEYGRFLSHNNKEIGFEHVAHYDEGITADQVMASGSYPVNFDFAKIEVESYISEPTNNRQVDAKTNWYFECQRLQEKHALFLGWGTYDQYPANAISYIA